jgi:hypothetical protein
MGSYSANMLRAGTTLSEATTQMLPPVTTPGSRFVGHQPDACLLAQKPTEQCCVMAEGSLCSGFRQGESMGI